MNLLAASGIPSPSTGVWYLGPIPLRAYGIVIAVGMIVGVWWTARRYRARGGDPDVLYDVAMWAIPIGIIGARLYHVVTSPEAYFGPGGDPWLIPQIWRGGLGIWGGVGAGALGAFLAVKRAGVCFGPIADSLAPALLVAQAIGRWGNWFNQELFGGPTTLPWGLQIDAAHLPAGARHARNDYGDYNYGGACPPPGDTPHRYIYTLYALDSSLDLPADATPAVLGFSLNGKVLASGQLTALYGQ